MSTVLATNESRAITGLLDGWVLPDDFHMPTAEEIEQKLALREPSWKGLINGCTLDVQRMYNLAAKLPRPQF